MNYFHNQVSPTSPVSPASIQAAKKHSIYPSTVHYMLQNHPYIHSAYKDTLSEYYLLYWEAEYFLKQMQEGEGSILRHGNRYHICFHKDLSRGKLIQAVKEGKEGKSKSCQVALSFRRALPEFNLPAYVFVSMYPGK